MKQKTIQMRFRNCISFIWFKNILVKYIKLYFCFSLRSFNL